MLKDFTLRAPAGAKYTAAVLIYITFAYTGGWIALFSPVLAINLLGVPAVHAQHDYCGLFAA